MEISRTALAVEWRRLEVIAENLANASSTHVAGGGAYQPRHVVSGPAASFAGRLGEGPEGGLPGGVTIYSVSPDTTPPRLVHEPANPDADTKGFVAYPGIDLAQEMILMIKTQRAYESNIAAMTAARQMYAKALEIGKRQ